MNKILSKEIANFLKDKPVKKAYLFGSVSRNEQNENSDIDILLELDYTNPIGLGFVRMKFELEELLNRKVDLVTLNGISKYIKPYVDSDKILIYEK